MNGPISQVTLKADGTLSTKAPSDLETTNGTSPSFVALVNTLGHAILVETLKMAAYYLIHSNGTSHRTRFYNEGRGCYVFLQGTGLDCLLTTYELNYDPYYLRKGFYYCLKKSL